jgi:hypothetical protein
LRSIRAEVDFDVETKEVVTTVTPMLEIVGSDIKPTVLTGILQRDGAAIVEDALAPATLSGINSDVNDVLADTVPIEDVKKMPVCCQELLDYKTHQGIGVVDVGSPMKLLV